MLTMGILLPAIQLPTLFERIAFFNNLLGPVYMHPALLLKLFNGDKERIFKGFHILFNCLQLLSKLKLIVSSLLRRTVIETDNGVDGTQLQYSFNARTGRLTTTLSMTIFSDGPTNEFHHLGFLR